LCVCRFFNWLACLSFSYVENNVCLGRRWTLSAHFSFGCSFKISRWGVGVGGGGLAREESLFGATGLVWGLVLWSVIKWISRIVCARVVGGVTIFWFGSRWLMDDGDFVISGVILGDWYAPSVMKNIVYGTMTLCFLFLLVLIFRMGYLGRGCYFSFLTWLKVGLVHVGD